jgi:hypothetical protein
VAFGKIDSGSSVLARFREDQDRVDDHDPDEAAGITRCNRAPTSALAGAMQDN